MKKILAVLLSVLLLCSTVVVSTAAPAADAPVMDGATLVTFGDSLTALSTWPQSVAKALNMNLVNAGIGGNTTEHAAARFERDVAAHNPDFVIMCFGTNDFYRENGVNPRVDLATYKTNLQSFIDQVKNLGAEPILMTPPFIAEYASGGPSIYPEGTVNGALDNYVNAMREIASTNGVGLIDIHAVCDSDSYDVSSFLIADGVHLSAFGNEVYTDTICSYMTANYNQDPSAPRVEYPTAPKAEAGVWTKSLVPFELEDWLIIYPDTMYGVEEADGSISFANTNGLWPEVHYSPALPDAIAAPIEGSYLTIDMELEAASNIILFFNGPTPTLAYDTTYLSLTESLAAAIPTLQTSGSDILGGQSVYTTLALKDIIPSSFIADDGTVLFTGVKVFAVGAADTKVTIEELSVTTTDPNVTPIEPTYRDAHSLLPTDPSQIAQNQGTVDFALNADNSLTLARAAESDITWPSVAVTAGKTINLSQTPYLHLQMTTGGGYANGYLSFTNAYGTQTSVQLSQLVNGDANDFTTDLDVYVDLAKYLGTTGTVTLNSYTLSVYGVVGDDITWTALSAAGVAPDGVSGDANGDGTVSTADATLIFRHLLDVEILDAAALSRSDYNGDSNVNSSDVREILTDLVNTI